MVYERKLSFKVDPTVLSTLVHLSYSQFACHLWEKKIRKIGWCNITPDRIKEFLILAGEIFYKTKDFQPVKRPFEQAIIELSSSYESEGFDSIQNCEEAIDALKQSSFMELDCELDPRGVNIKRLKPKQPPLWGWHIAQSLILCLKSSIANSETEYTGIENFEKELQDFFHQSTSFKIFAEYILAFFLLQLESSQNEECINKAYIARLWKLSLNLTNETSAATCFAAPKASSIGQKVVEQWKSGNMEDQDKWRVLFAYLYFVGTSLRPEFKIESRFHLLQPHYSAIKNAGLADYFVFTVSRLLKKELKNKELLAALPYLEGCETIGVAKELAETAIWGLVHNEKDIKVQLRDFLGYLSGCSNLAKEEYRNPKPKHEHHHLRYYFREWMLREFCIHLVNNEYDSPSIDHKNINWPKTIYDILSSHNWYECGNGKNQGNDEIYSKVRFEMQCEANIALGIWYRNNNTHEEARKSFVKFLWQLTHSHDSHVREIVPYIIKHTEPIPQWADDSNVHKEPRLDAIFYPILDELFTHGEIPETMGHLKGFIEINRN